MCRGEECREKQTTAPSAGDVCGDRLPHLRCDFMTCTKACTQPHGHRPQTPHRCADGHEWRLDEVGRDLQNAADFPANPNKRR